MKRASQKTDAVQEPDEHEEYQEKPNQRRDRRWHRDTERGDHGFENSQNDDCDDHVDDQNDQTFEHRSALLCTRSDKSACKLQRPIGFFSNGLVRNASQ